MGAGVYPPELVAQMPAAQTEQEAQLPGIVFRMFASPEAAAAWLVPHA